MVNVKKDSIRDYIQATRPHLAIFFVEVIIGALVAVNFDFNLIDLNKILIIFISFQSLYYGIYIINDIIDYKTDRISLRKQHRPIASDRLTKKNASILAIILILISFLISLNTYKQLAYFEIFFLTYVIFYSLYLKKIPYIDTIAGSVTHMARVVMGIALFGVFTHYILAIFLLLLFTCTMLMKRIKEIKYKENVGRPIGFYSKEKIRFAWIIFPFISLFLLYLAQKSERSIILSILIVYCIAMFFYFKNSKVMRLFERIAD